jgi:hypothetical protein
MPRIEHPNLHSEDSVIPSRGSLDIGDIDDEMIKGGDADWHGVLFEIDRDRRRDGSRNVERLSRNG